MLAFDFKSACADPAAGVRAALASPKGQYIPDFAMWAPETGFDRECVSSNPVTPANQSRLRTPGTRSHRKARQLGLIGQCKQSPSYQIGNEVGQFAESLHGFIELFPFFGVVDRRLFRSSNERPVGSLGCVEIHGLAYVCKAGRVAPV